MENSQKLDMPMPIEGDRVYYGESGSPNLGVQLSEGGEGIIYRGIGGELYKIYYREALNPEKQKKLEEMLSLREKLPQNICWPKNLIYYYSDARPIIGFAMDSADFIQRNKSIAPVTLSEAIVQIADGSNAQWDIDRTSLVRLCIKTVDTFTKLHSAGILMGDINPRNILVDRDCDIYFIDTDSYQFGKHICPVGMELFSSPRLHKSGCKYSQNPRTIEDEYYAIACLVFYILFLGKYPYNLNSYSIKDCIVDRHFIFNEGADCENYIWLNLSPRMRATFKDVFSHGETVSTKEWSGLLNEMYNMITASKLSNEIFPSDFLDEKTDVVWKYEICDFCGKKFGIASKNKTEALCSVCREKRNVNRTHIYSVTCKKCGKKFTVNRWDSRNAQINSILCPDCDQDFALPFEDLLNENGGVQTLYRQSLANLSKRSNKKRRI